MATITDGIKMISEGRHLEDKILISGYLFFRVPIHFIMRLFGAKKINNNLPRNIFIKNRDGLFFCGRNIFSVSTCSSVWEKGVTDEIKKFMGGVFIDVGSNVGKYPVVLGNKLKEKIKIIAIEPIKENIEIIKKSLALNKIGSVTLVEAACGASNKTMDFYVDPTGAGGGSSSFIKQQKKSIKVKVIKLDRIIKSLKIKQVDLMKIDVEGAESDVLKGAIKTLKKFHPKIIFEAWDDKYLQKCLDVLKPLGYKVKKISEENYLAI